MQNDRINVSDTGKSLYPKPEIDSSPKTYTLSQQIISGLKMALVAAIMFLLLWLFDKMQLY